MSETNGRALVCPNCGERDRDRLHVDGSADDRPVATVTCAGCDARGTVAEFTPDKTPEEAAAWARGIVAQATALRAVAQLGKRPTVHVDLGYVSAAQAAALVTVGARHRLSACSRQTVHETEQRVLDCYDLHIDGNGVTTGIAIKAICLSRPATAADKLALVEQQFGSAA